MSDLPPKQGPENVSDHNTGDSAGGMLAMYNAAGSGGDSFPVLKAFQDYIEAERAQARTRIIQLTALFSVLIALVVAGFLAAGMAMWKKNADTESKLLEAVLAMKTAPAPAPVQTIAPAPAPIINVPDPSPIVEESIRQISRLTSDMQSSLDKKLDGVTDLTSQVHDKVASQESEFEKMRGELQKMQEQSTQLQTELAAVKQAAAQPQPTPTPPPAAPAQAEPATAPPAQQAALAPQERPPPLVSAKREPRFPPAVKDPPPPSDVTPPPPPEGMITTAIPVKGKNLGSIPWRVIIPE